jgi:hypothetical protein
MATRKPPKKSKKTKAPTSGSQQLAGYNVRQGKSDPIKTKKTNDLIADKINKDKRRAALKKQITTNNNIKKITGVKPKSNRSKSQLRAIFAKKK